ncbi:MAG: radical SAM/SPASM domain-containing protein [Planctomycetota bacterium]
MQRPHPLQAANPPVTHVYLRKNGSSFAALKAENSSLLREDIARGAVRYRGLPEVLTLNHTDLCNLRCVMCPRHLAQGVHRLSRRVLSYLCDELLPTAHKLVLTTSGGEPLAADFDFLLERALRYAVKLDVVTNGVLLTPELYRHARGALDHLNVSLDCHIPEVYHRIRLGADFARVESHLMAIRDARAREKDGVLFSVSAVVMRSNLPHLADFVRYAKRAGADAVVLQRLRHETKPTPEEEPTSYFTAAQIQESFALACAVAREESMNLFMSEFGLPGVMAEPLRSKIPPSLEGHGLCWFLAQDFGVMYTGEVYPCCIPTDHCLGNVLFEDPVAIWNGAPMVALRAAHLSKRGTTFCSGCLHAPHLAPRRPAALNAAARRVRVAFGHVRRTLARKLQARLAPPIFDPPLPAVVARDGRFAEAAGAARVIDRAPANEVLTRQRDMACGGSMARCTARRRWSSAARASRA